MEKRKIAQQFDNKFNKDFQIYVKILRASGEQARKNAPLRIWRWDFVHP
jgi:hypothetical protein